MNKALLLTFIAIILIPCLIYWGGKWNMENRTRADLKALQSALIEVSGKTYTEDQLQGLPAPVQRFFKYALKNGQPYVSSVYLKHDGRFKTALDREWIKIEGEQYFTAEEPGFLWNGKTALFSVSDMYIAGKGRIRVSLLNLIRVVTGSGPEYDQGELLRWLGESVWFPTNLLPNQRLQWTALNDNEAELSFRYGEQNIGYMVSFNTEGEITQLETRRYMGKEGLETWIGRVSAYKEINGMKIPMKIEALWKLSDGEHSYAEFNIREIKHK